MSATLCASLVDHNQVNSVDLSTITSSLKSSESLLKNEREASADRLRKSIQQVDQDTRDACERCSKVYRSRDVYVKCIYNENNVFDLCDQLLKYKPTFARKDGLRSSLQQLMTRLSSYSPSNLRWRHFAFNK